MLFRSLAHQAYVTEVAINRQEIRMAVYPKARLNTEKLPELIARYRGDLKMQAGDSPGLFYQERNGKNKDSIKMMEKAEELLKGLGELVEKTVTVHTQCQLVKH